MSENDISMPNCHPLWWANRGESARLKGKKLISIRFAPKAHLWNFLWWGRSMRLLDRSWPPVLGYGVRHDPLKERFLNFSRMTERFSYLRSKKDATHFPGTMKYSCRTQTLCLEEGPPWWPPSSGECSLLVPLPEPARDPPAWERPRWKAAAERHDSLLLQWVWPIETHLAVVSMLPNSLLREPVSQDWPLVYLELQARCPEVEDR